MSRNPGSGPAPTKAEAAIAALSAAMAPTAERMALEHHNAMVSTVAAYGTALTSLKARNEELLAKCAELQARAAQAEQRTSPELEAKLVEVFDAYVRLRDAGRPLYSAFMLDECAKLIDTLEAWRKVR